MHFLTLLEARSARSRRWQDLSEASFLGLWMVVLWPPLRRVVPLCLCPLVSLGPISFFYKDTSQTGLSLSQQPHFTVIIS